MLDLIAIGDATLDTFVIVHDATVSCSITKENCLLCFNYADKIPIEQLVKVIGGNAANNAVGARRLGLKTALVTTTGLDETGAQIRATLKREGVNSRYVTLDRKRPSNYSVVLSFQGERTILVYHEPRRYAMPKLPNVPWIYLTALGKNSEPLLKGTAAYIKARRGKSRLGFNPGTHQLRLGLPALKPVIAQCSIIFLNTEEAATLLGKPGADVRTLLAAYHSLGARNVVITDGPKGSYASDGFRAYFMPIAEAPVVERTGAGDSYATGFLAARYHGKDLVEAMRWGTLNSASVVGKIGPQAGLLTKAQMAIALRKSKSLTAQRLS